MFQKNKNEETILQLLYSRVCVCVCVCVCMCDWWLLGLLCTELVKNKVHEVGKRESVIGDIEWKNCILYLYAQWKPFSPLPIIYSRKQKKKTNKRRLRSCYIGGKIIILYSETPCGGKGEAVIGTLGSFFYRVWLVMLKASKEMY